MGKLEIEIQDVQRVMNNFEKTMYYHIKGLV